MSSLAGLLLFSAAATALREGLGVAGVGVSALLAAVPGFALLAGSAAADAAATPASSSDGSRTPPDGKSAGDHDADAALVPTGVPLALAGAGAELVRLGPSEESGTAPPPPIVELADGAPPPAAAPLYPLPVQLAAPPPADPATAVLCGSA